MKLTSKTKWAAMMAAGMMTLAASSAASASQTNQARIVVEPEQEITNNAPSDLSNREIIIREEMKVEEMPVEALKPSGEEPIFMAVEQMPQYPGGQNALMRDLNAHLFYPIAAAEDNIQGKAVVRFVVEKDGSIGPIQLVRTSGDNSLDREALRVPKTLKNFIPGKQNGQPVRVWYTIPVTFKLQQADEPVE